MSDQDLNKIASGAGIIFVGMILSKIFAYLYRLIIARIGVSEYGLISLGLGIIGIISSISIIGLHRGVLRNVSYYRGKEDFGKVKGVITLALKISLGISLVLSILLFIFSDFISVRYFHNEDLSLIIKILAVSIPLSVMNEIILNTILGFQKVVYMVISKNIILNLSRFLLTIAFVLFSRNILGLAWIYVISFLVSFIFSFYFLERKVFPILITKIKSISVGKELFSFSWPLVFSGLGMLLVGWTDTIMLGFFKTVNEVGYYNTALPTSHLLYIVPQGLMMMVIPTLTYLFSRKEMDKFNIITRTTTKWVFMINLILFSLFMMFGKEIISILFGAQYSIAGDVLRILSVGFFINYTMIFMGHMPIIKNRPKWDLFNISIVAITNIILNFILIPPYGIFGAAIATSVSFVIFGIIELVEALYIFNVDNPIKLVYLKVIISIIIASFLTSYLANNLISVNNLINLVIISLILTIVYSVLLIVTRSFDKEDSEVIKSIQNKIGINIPFIDRFI